MYEITVPKDRIYHRSRITHYPDGSVSVMTSNRSIFREPGWCSVGKPERVEDADPYAKLEADSPERYMALVEDEGYAMETAVYAEGVARSKAESLERAQRRARNAVRDLALSNDFRFFVTLTLDPAKVDRYDVSAITKKLRIWADNAVRRKGLEYILVPELHRDGAVHFHGFFNDALEAVDSGTLTDGGRPRKPRSASERKRLEADGWHTVYNLPAWTLGFTTAIELYGERRRAVAYVLKYISKAAETTGRIGGRWYYSGGDLRRPRVSFDELDVEAVQAVQDSWSAPLENLGAVVAVAHMAEADYKKLQFTNSGLLNDEKNTGSASEEADKAGREGTNYDNSIPSGRAGRPGVVGLDAVKRACMPGLFTDGASGVGRADAAPAADTAAGLGDGIQNGEAEANRL